MSKKIKIIFSIFYSLTFSSFKSTLNNQLLTHYDILQTKRYLYFQTYQDPRSQFQLETDINSDHEGKPTVFCRIDKAYLNPLKGFSIIN